MSPHVGNFVHDLVEMAKAMERLPGLEAEIARLQGMVDNYAQQVQAIELRAIDRNTEIEQLNAKIRSLEVERDDASFRVMEAEDREHILLNHAKVIQNELSMMLFSLDPPKPEPEPTVSATPDSQPELAAQPSHLDAQDPLPHGENTQPTSGSLTSSAEQSPIDPHQTEVPGSVSTDPIPETTGASVEPIPVLDTSASSVHTPPAFDPEPNERWSSEWYAWKDRQYKQA